MSVSPCQLADGQVIHMNKKKIIITVIIIVIFLGSATAWVLFRPPMPAKWNQLEPGMSRDEVLTAFPEMVTVMYAVKGLDTIQVENEMPWFPNGYWMLSLSYNRDEKIKFVGYHYVNRVIGLLNVTVLKE